MKKFISILLTVASMSGLCMTVNADEHQNAPHELGLLNAISFISDEGYSENDVMTRAEFCGMVCKLFKYENYSTSEMSFRDIDSTHPHYNSVSALYAKGAVKGVSKYSMAPNKPITLEEAGIIVVSALGYTDLVESGMTTYTAKASELGIYDGLNVSRATGLTEKMANTMMYNTLFAPIVFYEPYGEAISYSSDEDILMMNEVYDMYETEGVVNENDVTSLFGVSKLQENEIRIDETVYVSKMQEADDLLGYAVKAYYIENDTDDDTLIYAYPDKRKTNEIEIASEDIENAVKTQIDYDEDNKLKNAKLSKAADVVYNGIGLESYDNTVLNPAYGKLKLVDNDGDDIYDVVFVTKYDFYLVQSAAMSDSEVYIADAKGNTLRIQLDSVECTVNVWLNDNQKDFSEIKSGTGLLAVDSGTVDGIRLIDFYILPEKVSGVLSSANSKNLVIDGKTYEVSPLLDTSALSEYVSKNVSCFIDIYGKAIYITTETSGTYGFLLKAYFLEDDETVQVKILETNNEWKKYNLKEKVRCNADSVKASDMLNKITGNEVVRYTVNSDGLISRLDVAMYYEDETGKIDRDRDVTMRKAGYFRKSLHKEFRRYAHNTKGLFDGQGYSRWVDCFFPGTMYVLVRPDSADIKEEQVLFYTGSYFKTDKDYWTEVYDLTEDNYSPLVVVYGDASVTVSDGSELLLVDSIREELDEDDMVAKRLYAWSSGALKPFDGANSTAFEYKGAEVKRGDLFRVAKNFNDEIEYVEQKLAFRVDANPEAWFSDKSSAGTLDGFASHRHQLAIGRVSEVNGDLLRVRVKDNQYINAKLRNEAYYYVYDESNSKQVITKGTRNDIRIGDVVVARLYVGRLDQVFIYKNL